MFERVCAIAMAMAMMEGLVFRVSFVVIVRE